MHLSGTTQCFSTPRSVISRPIGLNLLVQLSQQSCMQAALKLSIDVVSSHSPEARSGNPLLKHGAREWLLLFAERMRAELYVGT